jgi:hypothetical protein
MGAVGRGPGRAGLHVGYRGGTDHASVGIDWGAVGTDLETSLEKLKACLLEKKKKNKGS